MFVKSLIRASALAAVILVSSPRPAAAQTVPTPESVLGHKPGDERYLLTRDKGPVRRYVRDVVDARRNVLGLFMPSALALLFIMFAVPQLQLYISPAMLVLMALMMLDGLILGRKVARRVDEKFPDNTESRWKLGLYAASRASQMRRMRAPRPQVKHGSSVD